MRSRMLMVSALVAGLMATGTGAGLAHGGGGGAGHGGGGHGRGGHGSERPPAGGYDAPRKPDHHRPGDRAYQRGVSSFSLSGSEVPGGGDPDGRGKATLRLNPEQEVVCLTSDWTDLAGDVTGIHVHRGLPGQEGPHHIEILNDESLSGAWNRVEFCVRVTGGHGGGDPADVIQEVVDDPAGFYLNVHTTAHPKGAIRGQLRG